MSAESTKQNHSYSTNPQELIAEFVKLRNRLGLTQDTAALILETSQSWVSTMEKGSRTPHVLMIEGAIARLQDWERLKQKS